MLFTFRMEENSPNTSAENGCESEILNREATALHPDFWRQGCDQLSFVPKRDGQVAAVSGCAMVTRGPCPDERNDRP